MRFFAESWLVDKAKTLEFKENECFRRLEKSGSFVPFDKKNTFSFFQSFSSPLPWSECPKVLHEINQTFEYSKECGVSKSYVKFGLSEKHTKICTIFLMLWTFTYIVNVQSMRQIFSNFVCLSESPNFNFIPKTMWPKYVMTQA